MGKRVKTAETLRSNKWLNAGNFRSFNHRSRMMQMGFGLDDWDGSPIIGIMNTWSDINPCHHHFKERVEDVKRGVLQAGGLPLEIPCMSLFESMNKPSALLYRNMLAMEVEELLRSYPIDGVILMGGCDKTAPGLLLGAISMQLPTVFIPAGPMLRGNYRGETLGSGSDAFKSWDEYRVGNLCDNDLEGICGGLARSVGTCMTMGTASTMTSIIDAMGMCMPGASSIPAVDTNHNRMCSSAGKRVVDMVWEDITPDKILTKEAFENGIVAAMALGGSTNSIIHVIAMARRAGCDIGIEDFDRISREVPVIANIRPSGDKYLMEDFYYAGGILGMLNRLKPYLHLEENSIVGETIGDIIEKAEIYNDDVIRPLDNPVYKEGSLAVLKGNLAPDGCVIKASACNPKFLNHSGKAIVFDNYQSLKEFTDDESVDVTEDNILILRNAGPKGGPGMPEWGMLPLPKKLIRQGVRDMLRISDARMSGTSYGSCILHVAPESYIGGPLAFVKTGDVISVDVYNRSINLEISEQEMEERRANWQEPAPRYNRGFGWMYLNHIQQADKGCDFDYLETSFGSPIDEPEIN
ncbi:L-arabinonate dehydratase [Alkalihalobacillus sp. MEB130]|uniref:L-arabinonate dehydratase n=1 Tax=Alkalihalobacillus sp. MEB130 TaxID=2976704 RepID=UPI0028E057C3|nr:L-arabinonate dehydratase [Alkalihalobacillus sp. MEB130]MDT8862142.1 L-arabinonate dehydratase [Alkalihalobacillus sp. MEB130]